MWAETLELGITNDAKDAPIHIWTTPKGECGHTHTHHILKKFLVHIHYIYTPYKTYNENKNTSKNREQVR